MRNNSIIKLLCSIPVILVVLYFIPFLGVCLLIFRYIVYYYDKRRISTPYYLVSIGLIILIPKLVQYIFKTFNLKTSIIPYFDTIINSNLYNTDFIKYSKLLIILGIIFIVLLSIIRMPYAVMIGVVVMFSALLPIVGAFIACFIGAFLILLESPVKALVFVIVFLVVQQLENNLIYPRVVGSSIGLPAIWVFIAVTFGGSLFGVLGMLVFIPLFSTFYTLIKEDANNRIERKGS